MLGFRARSLLSYLFLFISAANALHFYLDANEKRCFIEELPTDTVVEGKHYHKMSVYYPAHFLTRFHSPKATTVLWNGVNKGRFTASTSSWVSSWRSQ